MAILGGRSISLAPSLPNHVPWAAIDVMNVEGLEEVDLAATAACSSVRYSTVQYRRVKESGH